MDCELLRHHRAERQRDLSVDLLQLSSIVGMEMTASANRGDLHHAFAIRI